jgi:hypothetical protein
MPGFAAISPAGAINPKVAHRLRDRTVEIATALLDELGDGRAFDFY